MLSGSIKQNHLPIFCSKNGMIILFHDSCTKYNDQLNMAIFSHADNVFNDENYLLKYQDTNNCFASIVLH